jgi:hypothetical protein
MVSGASVGDMIQNLVFWKSKAVERPGTISQQMVLGA